MNARPIQSVVPFQFESYAVRTINHDGEIWFVASDVCAALEITNVTMALRRLDDDEQALSSIEGISKLVQHPFCKFFGCWFCAAVLAGALRACSARGAEDGTAARRNIDRPYPQAISSGHSYLYPRRNRQHGTTRRTSPSGGGFCGAAE